MINTAGQDQWVSEDARYFRQPHAPARPAGGDASADSSLTTLEDALLNFCVKARTLDQHARFCQQQLLKVPDGRDASLEEIKRLLVGLTADGHLVSERFLLERCRQVASRGVPENKIDRVGFVTCERPESLLRCVTSFVSNARTHGRDCQFIITDDTRDPKVCDETREAVRALAKDRGVEIAYHAAEEKRRFVELLAAREGGIPREVIEFALFDVEGCGVSTGANRNALMLYTLNRLVFCADDDVVCRVAPAPGAEGVLVVGNSERLNDFWFFPNREAVLKAVEFIDLDVLALHEELLGAEVARCVSERADDSALRLEAFDHQFYNSLTAGKARVRFTYNGVCGDSGMKSPSRYLSLGGPSRARLLDTEMHYRTVCKSREVLRTSMRPLITSNAWCMATSFAYDNRSLLPPFFPVMRNSDGVYGQILKVTLKDACYGHLPYMLLHAPLEQRAYADPLEFNAAAFLSSFNIVIACLRSYTTRGGSSADVADNICRLGRHLSEIGSLPPPDFQEFIRLQLIPMWHTQAEALERSLRLHRGTPAYWAEDVERQLNNLRKVLLRTDMTPINLSRGRKPEEARLLMRRLIYRFGQVLCWWPAIISAAAAADNTSR